MSKQIMGILRQNDLTHGVTTNSRISELSRCVCPAPSLMMSVIFLLPLVTVRCSFISPHFISQLFFLSLWLSPNLVLANKHNLTRAEIFILFYCFVNMCCQETKTGGAQVTCVITQNVFDRKVRESSISVSHVSLGQTLTQMQIDKAGDVPEDKDEESCTKERRRQCFFVYALVLEGAVNHVHTTRGAELVVLHLQNAFLA